MTRKKRYVTDAIFFVCRTRHNSLFFVQDEERVVVRAPVFYPLERKEDYRPIVRNKQGKLVLHLMCSKCGSSLAREEVCACGGTEDIARVNCDACGKALSTYPYSFGGWVFCDFACAQICCTRPMETNERFFISHLRNPWKYYCNACGAPVLGHGSRIPVHDAKVLLCFRCDSTRRPKEQTPVRQLCALCKTEPANPFSIYNTRGLCGGCSVDYGSHIKCAGCSECVPDHNKVTNPVALCRTCRNMHMDDDIPTFSVETTERDASLVCVCCGNATALDATRMCSDCRSAV